MRNEAHTAIVTGASSGIGEAFARRLAAEGYRVVIAARRANILRALARELRAAYGVAIEILPADLSTEAGIRRLEARIAGDPTVEVVINCAGFGTRGLFHEVPSERIAEMIRLHVLAPARFIRAALPAMRAAGRGSIVNVSSVGAYLTTARYVTYSATKAFLNMLTRGLAEELRRTGITVQALCPGLTRTGFMHTEEFRDFHYDHVPDFLWMTPEQVVDESMKGLRRGKTIVVPGFLNRIFLGVLRTPVFSHAIGLLLRLSGRELY